MISHLIIVMRVLQPCVSLFTDVGMVIIQSSIVYSGHIYLLTRLTTIILIFLMHAPQPSAHLLPELTMSLSQSSLGRRYTHATGSGKKVKMNCLFL